MQARMRIPIAIVKCGFWRGRGVGGAVVTARLAAGHAQPMTEPISPVRSNKKAEEINKYINSQVIVPPIVRMQSKKMISMQGKEVKSVAKAQRRRAAAYLHHKS